MSRFHRLIIILSLVFLGILAIDYSIKVSIWVYLFLAFLLLGMLIVGATSMRYQLFLPALTRAKNINKQVAITFDDGPNEKTEAVLALLMQYGAKATFFCVGHRIESHPDILMKIHNQGHTIGNHSYSHHHLFNIFSSSRMKEEIRKTGDIIVKLIGQKPLLFRPPHGVTNPPTARVVKDLGLTVIGWSIRSFDTVGNDKNRVIRKITKNIAPGSVILLHEHVGSSEVILEEMLRFIDKNGYQCIGVDELFKIKAYA